MSLPLSFVVAVALPQAEHSLEEWSTRPPASAFGSASSPPTVTTPVVPPLPAGSPDVDDIAVNQITNSIQHEPTIAVNPTDPDHWVGAAIDHNSGVIQIGWYTTLDRGSTWSQGLLPLKPGFQLAGDPSVTFTPDGTVHVLGMQWGGPGGEAVHHYRSFDGGLTWKRGKAVDTALYNDKPMCAADHSGGPHHGDLAVAWFRFAPPISLLAATYDGSQWTAPVAINDPASTDPISPDVAYGPNSELYVMWADRTANQIWMDRSLDGGATWGTDRLVANYTPVVWPLAGSNFLGFDIFEMAVDTSSGPYRGNLYVAFHAWNGNNADLHVVTSSDGGLTWTGGPVHTGPGADQFYPALHVDPFGNVNCAYYDRRNDPANLLMWTWLSRSSDGGATWTEHRVSDLGWDHRVTEGVGGAIGHYIEVGSSAQAVHPIWCDGRTGSQDLYTDNVNLALRVDADTLSAATGGQVTFTINAGPALGGDQYLVLGSASGTTPGLTFPNKLHVPLNFDVLLAHTIGRANTPMFPATQGILDGTGSASAGLDTLGPLPNSAVGFSLSFSVVVTGLQPVFASDPVTIEIVP